MSRRGFRILVGFLLLLLAGLLMWLARPLPPVRMPQPNGYDDFLEAGLLLTNSPTGTPTTQDYRTLSTEQLRPIVEQNVVALERLRAGLERECRVPMHPAASFSNHIDDLKAVKTLAAAVCAEGQLAQLEGRTNDAVRSFLEVIRLGEESSRGGMFLDHYTGLACEALGVSGLEKLRATFNAKECRTLAMKLEAIEHRREPLENAVDAERRWVRANFGLGQRLWLVIFNRSFDPAARYQASYLQKARVQVQRQGALLIAVALRAYELEKGAPPSSLDALVPDYLHAVPKSAVPSKP